MKFMDMEGSGHSATCCCPVSPRLLGSTQRPPPLTVCDTWPPLKSHNIKKIYFNFNCDEIHITKLTISTILSVQLSSIKCTHIIGRKISRIFSPCKMETPHSLINKKPHLFCTDLFIHTYLITCLIVSLRHTDWTDLNSVDEWCRRHNQMDSSGLSGVIHRRS